MIPLYASIHSLQPAAGKTFRAFHAKDDHLEIRSKVFELLLTLDFKFYAVIKDMRSVLRYVENRNRMNTDYRYHPNELYDLTVRMLFKQRLHKHDLYRITFARRGKSDRTKALSDHLEQTRQKFLKEQDLQHEPTLEIQPAYPWEQPGLQIAEQQRRGRTAERLPDPSRLHDDPDQPGHLPAPRGGGKPEPQPLRQQLRGLFDAALRRAGENRSWQGHGNRQTDRLGKTQLKRLRDRGRSHAARWPGTASGPRALHQRHRRRRDRTQKQPHVHQYFGIKQSQKKILKHLGGIIWHTQGSGKSIVMVLLAKWILENLPKARVLILTDRDELDKQIERVFTDAGEDIYRASSGKDLMAQLGQAAPRLLCPLVHKFGKKGVDDFDAFIKELRAQRGHAVGELFIFVDECHRTQSGKLHKTMKALLPGAVFIGFTSTPLLKKDKETSYNTYKELLKNVEAQPGKSQTETYEDNAKNLFIK